MKDEIVKLLAFSKLSKKELKDLIEIPSDIHMGDYAFPCFSLSKKLKKKPVEIAEDIVKRFKDINDPRIINPCKAPKIISLILSFLSQGYLHGRYADIFAFIRLEGFAVYLYISYPYSTFKKSFTCHFCYVYCPGNEFSTCFYYNFAGVFCRKLHHYTGYVVHKRLSTNKNTVI